MTAGAAPPELHLPDLPEVSVALGPMLPPPPGRGPRPPWTARLRDALSAYLPLLLMVLLALFTWWLVKNTPHAADAPAAAAVRRDPDYRMSNFSLVRYQPDGRMRVRIEGQALRHFPDTDRVEIDEVRVHAVSPDGRVTDAQARRALANGDATEVQLIGGAQVRAQDASGQVLEIESEFLHAFLDIERVRTHVPVLVRQDRSQVRAGSLDYDNLTRQLQLGGPVRGTYAARKGSR